MGAVDPKGGIGQVILAVILGCVASWAGLIVLLVRISTSSGNHVAEIVLLGWMALTVALVVALVGTPLAARAGTGWQRIVPVIILVPALPLLAAGVYVWKRTQPFRQSRADRRRTAAR